MIEETIDAKSIAYEIGLGTDKWRVLRLSGALFYIFFMLKLRQYKTAPYRLPVHSIWVSEDPWALKKGLKTM